MNAPITINISCDKTFIKFDEYSKLIGASPKTVRKMADQGLIVTVKIQKEDKGKLTLSEKGSVFVDMVATAFLSLKRT